MIMRSAPAPVVAAVLVLFTLLLMGVTRVEDEDDGDE
jgi:hypothetical protein